MKRSIKLPAMEATVTVEPYQGDVRIAVERDNWKLTLAMNRADARLFAAALQKAADEATELRKVGTDSDWDSVWVEVPKALPEDPS